MMERKTFDGPKPHGYWATVANPGKQTLQGTSNSRDEE
jgi:hypothetical protein